MIEIETLYINCDDTHDIARIGNSQIWKIDHSHVFPHISTMSCLSPLFHSAQLINDSYCDIPYRVSCLIHKDISYIGKFKEIDQETIYDRLKWYIRNLLPPKNGIIFTFYTTEFRNLRYHQPWALTSMWPMKEKNTPLNKYMTYHHLENAFFTDGRSNKSNYEREKVYRLRSFYPYYKVCLNKIKNICKENGYELYPIDYSQKYQETYELLLGSNAHFTYGGGTTTLSMACDTPTFHIIGANGDFEKKIRVSEEAYSHEGEQISYEYDGNHPIGEGTHHHKSDKGASYGITRDYKTYTGLFDSWNALYNLSEVKLATLSHLNL